MSPDKYPCIFSRQMAAIVYMFFIIKCGKTPEMLSIKRLWLKTLAQKEKGYSLFLMKTTRNALQESVARNMLLTNRHNAGVLDNPPKTILQFD